MTTLQLNLPDDLVQRAQSAGLLTDAAMQKLLEEAIRRDAGQRLLDVGKRLQDAKIPPISDEEINAEIKAVRAMRRTRNPGNRCD